MTPLHEALIEVHREYDKASRATKDTAKSYKRATATLDRLQEQCSKAHVEKDELSKKLQ